MIVWLRKTAVGLAAWTMPVLFWLSWGNGITTGNYSMLALALIPAIAFWAFIDLYSYLERR